MNWNYSGRDDEEASLRKVLQHRACCFETDTILTGNGVDNPASYGTFPRLLGRYVRELKLLSLPEAVRRMTGFNAERMGLRDRGRIATGLAADLVVFDPDTVGDDWTRGAPNRRTDRHRDRGAQRQRRRRTRPLRPQLARRRGAARLKEFARDTETRRSSAEVNPLRASVSPW